MQIHDFVHENKNEKFEYCFANRKMEISDISKHFCVHSNFLELCKHLPTNKYIYIPSEKNDEKRTIKEFLDFHRNSFHSDFLDKNRDPVAEKFQIQTEFSSLRVSSLRFYLKLKFYLKSRSVHVGFQKNHRQAIYFSKFLISVSRSFITHGIYHNT